MMLSLRGEGLGAKYPMKNQHILPPPSLGCQGGWATIEIEHPAPDSVSSRTIYRVDPKKGALYENVVGLAYK